MTDPVRARFARTADLAAAQAQPPELAEHLRRFASLSGDERVLDAGTGVGTMALAIAPHVREVVGLDLVPELLAHARARGEGVANVRFLEGDARALPFPDGSFDLAGTLRTLHHVSRPELVVAELARVTRAGGRVLVVDQIAPADPLAAIELDRFERARDPSHARLLPDGDLRALFEANGLFLVRAQFEREARALDPYLDLAACEGEARERARELAPGDPYAAEVGWYLVRKP